MPRRGAASANLVDRHSSTNIDIEYTRSGAPCSKRGSRPRHVPRLWRDVKPIAAKGQTARAEIAPRSAAPPTWEWARDGGGDEARKKTEGAREARRVTKNESEYARVRQCLSPSPTPSTRA